MEYNLERFVTAQESSYEQAFTEMCQGKKTTHWIWYIFPQIAGLGSSSTAKFYEIKDLNEARLYLNHKILGERLIEITNAVMNNKSGNTIEEIFGYPDYLKFHSCMTLFSIVDGKASSVFQKALDKFYDGKPDGRTVEYVK